MQRDFLASLLSAAISVADGGKPSALEFLPLICGAPREGPCVWGPSQFRL